MFQVRQQGKTLITRTQGTKVWHCRSVSRSPSAVLMSNAGMMCYLLMCESLSRELHCLHDGDGRRCRCKRHHGIASVHTSELRMSNYSGLCCRLLQRA